MIEIKSAELINIDVKQKDVIQEAKKIFLEGKVFVYPTDTLYGLGANPFNDDSIKRINKIKGREIGKMYILLISDIPTLQKYVDIKSEKHLDFLNSIWPNPISIILKLNNETGKILNSETAAFRIPNHRFCLKLLKEIKMPLISTSVNKSGTAPLNDPDLIEEEFSSEIDAIFYSDKKSFFLESTIIDLSDSKPKLIREGKIKFNDILEKFK
ncbi:MAG: L-threonylcarbamoyladenylate synthase [Ignavibacteriaceae bacterium]